jgi:hypothetical protein
VNVLCEIGVKADLSTVIILLRVSLTAPNASVEMQRQFRKADVVLRSFFLYPMNKSLSVDESRSGIDVVVVDECR